MDTYRFAATRCSWRTMLREEDWPGPLPSLKPVIQSSITVLLVHGTQVVFVDSSSDGPAQIRAGFLIGSEVNPAIHTRV